MALNLIAYLRQPYNMNQNNKFALYWATLYKFAEFTVPTVTRQKLNWPPESSFICQRLNWPRVKLYGPYWPIKLVTNWNIVLSQKNCFIYLSKLHLTPNKIYLVSFYIPIYIMCIEIDSLNIGYITQPI